MTPIKAGKIFVETSLISPLMKSTPMSTEAGFSVEYEGVREGKAFTKIKFTVGKTDGRQERETMLGRKANIHKRRARAIAGLADPDNPPMPSGDALDAFRRKWPGNDPYEVIGRFQDKWRDEGCA